MENLLNITIYLCKKFQEKGITDLLFMRAGSVGVFIKYLNSGRKLSVSLLFKRDQIPPVSIEDKSRELT